MDNLKDLLIKIKDQSNKDDIIEKLFDEMIISSSNAINKLINENKELYTKIDNITNENLLLRDLVESLKKNNKL